MPLVIADRVKETTTTTGTGAVTLAGAATGFRSFAAVGNGNTTYYSIVDSSTGAWEVGLGTYTASGTSLSRDVVLSSSNAGSKVSFGAGSKDVFVTQPAGRTVLSDGTGASGTWGISITGNAATVSSITSGQVTTALGYTPYQIRGVTTNLDTAASGIWRVDTGATGQPSGTDYGTVVVFDNASDTGFQFASDYSSANLWWRSGNAASMGGTGSWGAWRLVLHSGNYTSYAPSLTGGGASGTWNITANYANNLTQGFNSNWNTDFQQAPAGSTILRGDTSSGSSTGGPGGTWWFQQNMRHTNGSNFWGVQVAWGWEDNANILRTRNVQGGNFGSWVTYVNNGNYNAAINRGTFNRESNGGTMVAGQQYSIYTGGGAVGMYLPTAANTAQGDRIVIHNLLLQWATYPFYVYMNTNTRLMNLNETMTCNVNVGSIVLTCVYHDGTAYWNVTPGG